MCVEDRKHMHGYWKADTTDAVSEEELYRRVQPTQGVAGKIRELLCRERAYQEDGETMRISTALAPKQGDCKYMQDSPVLLNVRYLPLGCEMRGCTGRKEVAKHFRCYIPMEEKKR
jgi:hypothetical protein